MCTLDVGSKSIAAEAGDPAAWVLGSRGPGWTPLHCSEEHMPCRVAPGAPAPARGDIVYLVPEHVCPTVNLAERAVLVVKAVQVEHIRLTRPG